MLLLWSLSNSALTAAASNLIFQPWLASSTGYYYIKYAVKLLVISDPCEIVNHPVLDSGTPTQQQIKKVSDVTLLNYLPTSSIGFIVPGSNK